MRLEFFELIRKICGQVYFVSEVMKLFKIIPYNIPYGVLFHSHNRSPYLSDLAFILTSFMLPIFLSCYTFSVVNYPFT